MTIFNYIEKYAKEMPQQIAIVHKDKKVSYKELHNIICFHQQHHTKTMSERIILKVSNQADFIIALLTYTACGIWVIPVSPNIHHKELEEICKVTHTDKVIEDVNYLFSEHQENCFRQIDKELIKNGGIYHMTSGSTGGAKFVVRTISQFTYEGESYKLTFNITFQDRILNVPPLHHSFSLGAACFGGLVAGATVYVIDDFYPRKILYTISNDKITMLILVPFMAKILTEIKHNKKYDFTSLKVVLAGAGKLEQELSVAFNKVFGICLMSNYGSTETGGVFSRLQKEPFNSIGKPMNGVRYKLVDSFGREIQQGEEGELCIYTKNMGVHYFNEEKMDIDEQGFLNMHDVGTEDADGNIYILYRTKQIANIAGKKVSFVEVEKVLKSHEEVQECIVTKYEKANGTEAIQAIIKVNSKKIDEQKIREYCLKNLEPYKVPNKIIITKTMPYNEIGKVSQDQIHKIINQSNIS